MHQTYNTVDNEDDENSWKTSVFLNVFHMTCQSCVKNITNTLNQLEGIQSVLVNLETNSAYIEYNQHILNVSNIINAIEEIGFETSVGSENSLEIKKPDVNDPTNIIKSNTYDSKLSLLTLTENTDSIPDSPLFAPEPLMERPATPSLFDAKYTMYNDDNVNPLTSGLLDDSKDDMSFHTVAVKTGRSASPSFARRRPLSKSPSRPKFADISLDVGISHVKDNIYQSEYSENIETVNILIKGMTCSSCVMSIEKHLKDCTGIISASIVLLTEKCEIKFDSNLINVDEIINKIDEIGFTATIFTGSRQNHAVISISGMTCSSCTSGIESVVSKLPGINSISVNLLNKNATIDFNPTEIGIRDVLDTINDMGFVAELSLNSHKQQIEALSHQEEINKWKEIFKHSVFFTMVVFFAMNILPMISSSIAYFEIVAGLTLSDLMIVGFTTPLQFGTGRVFYNSAYKGVKHGIFNMDVLIVLGSTMAYIYSFYALCLAVISRNHIKLPLFFETSAFLITAVSLGRYLENRAKSKTSEAIANLLSLTPDTANLLTIDNSSFNKDYVDTDSSSEDMNDSKTGIHYREREILADLIKIGDILRVKPGERIPTDGVVVYGLSRVDESIITGEPTPVKKEINDPVIGGTVNMTGVLHIKATRIGEDTTLSHIVNLVSEAQTSKAPIQCFADTVAGYFVPCVLLIGISTFIIWLSFLNSTRWRPSMFADDLPNVVIALQFFISVTVVACPCALGLATPTAVMVGTGVGAKLGILFKSGIALEEARHITKIVFDKTGTLTKGILSVAKPIFYNDIPVDESYLWQAIRICEEFSDHPLAKCIVRYVESTYGVQNFVTDTKGNKDDLFASNFIYNPGYGVSCNVGQHHFLIGNLNLIKNGNNNSLPNNIEEHQADLEKIGMTVVHVAIDGIPCLMIPMADALKPEAILTIRAIKNLGIDCALCTGDSELTARYIANQCGISEVYSSTSPAGKQTIIKRMQDNGERVVMCGDGINDSASMASANIGIAVYGGTDIATETADVVLMRNDLQCVAVALHLARVIYRRIVTNFILASMYNLCIIPLAMGVLAPVGITLPAILISIAMSVSSVSVVVSSLLLVRYKPLGVH